MHYKQFPIIHVLLSLFSWGSASFTANWLIMQIYLTMTFTHWTWIKLAYLINADSQASEIAKSNGTELVPQTN
jgi:hypothetical protein